MKKRLKNLLLLAFLISGMGVLAIGLYVGYVMSDWNEDIDKEKIRQVILDIKAARQQDERLIALYNKIHKNALEKSSWRNAWDSMWGQYNECPCRNAVRMSRINKRHKLAENDFAVSVKIEREVSQRDCLNFLFERTNYVYKNIGVDAASEYYFKKQVSELNDDELIGLIIMHKNPVLYNPIRSRDRWEAKIKEVKKELKL